MAPSSGSRKPTTARGAVPPASARRCLPRTCFLASNTVSAPVFSSLLPLPTPRFHTHTHMQSPRPNMLRAPNTKFLTHSRHATNCSRSHRGPIRSPPLHYRHPPSLYHPTFAAVNERNAKYVAAFGQLAGCDKTLSITTIDSGHNVRVFPNLLCALNWGVPSISPQQRPNNALRPPRPPTPHPPTHTHCPPPSTPSPPSTLLPRTHTFAHRPPPPVLPTTLLLHRNRATLQRTTSSHTRKHPVLPTSSTVPHTRPYVRPRRSSRGYTTSPK